MHRGHVDDPDLAWRDAPDRGDLRGLMTAHDSLVHRLAQLGCAPADVTYVVNTHLHFDHAGNNDLFGDARLFVQREQWEFARDNPDFPAFCWDLPQWDYVLLDGETAVVDGVRVLPTPGHSPGHQSVVVRLPEVGTVILCGDAVMSARTYEWDDWGGHRDPVAARESGLFLRDLAERTGGRLIYGHDHPDIPPSGLR